MPQEPHRSTSARTRPAPARPRDGALSPALLARVFHQPALLYFVAAAECLSIREAARRLHVASSAVTRQVAQLEDALGLSLFTRDNRRLRLTTAGEILYRHARRLPGPLEAAVSELEMLRGNRTGSVRIASVESIGLSFLPGLIAAFGAQYPELSLELAIGTAAEVIERLADERADLGFGFIAGDPGGIEMSVRREVRVGAVLPPTHPLARARRLTLADCLQHPVAIAMPEISIRQVIDPFLMRLDRPLPALVEANSIRLLVELALSGRYVSIMTPLGAQEEILSGALVFRPLADEGMPTNHFGILARSISALQFAPAVFYRHARRYFEELGLPASA